MTMDRIVSLIAVFMALVLAWRGLSSYRLDARRRWSMGLAWVAIFVALVVLLRTFMPSLIFYG